MAKQTTESVNGVKRPKVKLGKADPMHTRIAKMATGGGGAGTKTAGMMIDTLSLTQPYQTGYRLNAYYNSYANGLQQRSGTYDVPTYFVQMNEQNGGILYWPVTLAEKYSWYRYWYRCFIDPNVLIMREDGTESPLREMKVGDKVINAKGQTVEVSAVTSRDYIGDVVRLELVDNMCHNLEVTAEHPFLVVRKDKAWSSETYRPEWVEAHDIHEGDCLVTPQSNAGGLVYKKKAFVGVGDILVEVKRVVRRQYEGLIWNISTDGATYDDRTFLVYGIATHNTDAYIGRAMDLLSDLPMSKFTLNMPKMEGKEALRKEIHEFFEYQCEVLNIFTLCQDILLELNLLGNTFIFLEEDEEKGMWSRAIFLPPEEVFLFQYPFSDKKRIEYRPFRLISLINGATTTTGGTDNISDEIIENIPDEITDMVKTHGCIVMDSDPMSGSFVHHIARRKHPYYDLGASLLERVLVPMLQKEHYRFTQLSLCSRNMTPKNLITAPGLLPDELDTLRTQVDLSYMDPDYSIITNYEVTWQQIGAQDRLLDLDREYERIENQVFAGLGVTRELLTGEGTFTGNRVTVEILNTMFLMSREVLKDFVEKTLFKPLAEKKGWYEVGAHGIKHYYYPEIGFNRLTIRDNSEVFQNLYQLYLKGSLPVDVLYELFNLNAEEMTTKLHKDLFTVKDATFNRFVEQVNSEVGRTLVEGTDLTNRIAKYLGLTMKPQEGEGGEGGFQQGFDGGDQPQQDDQSQEQVQEQPAQPAQPVKAPARAPAKAPAKPEQDSGSALDALTNSIAQMMPSRATDKDIAEVVKKSVGDSANA